MTIKKDMGQGDQPPGQPVESDPKKLAERHNDAQVAYLDVYRSLQATHELLDEELVTKCVEHGVVPAAIRYGTMKNGPMEVNRGVVKACNGALFYFNHVPEHTFHLVEVSAGKSDRAIKSKEQEAARLLANCTLGCDIRKPDDEPLEKAPQTGTIPEDEEEAMRGQQRMLRERHPGAAGGGTTPDNSSVGRNWHEPIRRSSEVTNPRDGMGPVTSNDGHWTATDLIKAYGQNLQATAPRAKYVLAPPEVQFVKEVLGKSQQEIDAGNMTFSPKQCSQFMKWQGDRLRANFTQPLQRWLDGK